MKNLFKLVVIVLVAIALVGCEKQKQLSREELPLIKETIFAFEQVIRMRSEIYIDSVISSDADRSVLTADSLFDFIYGDDLREFAGFTGKRIIYRGNAARADCFIAGPDGPTRPVTITLHKEDDIWLIKKIEPGLEEPILKDVDTVADSTEAESRE